MTCSKVALVLIVHCGLFCSGLSDETTPMQTKRTYMSTRPMATYQRRRRMHIQRERWERCRAFGGLYGGWGMTVNLHMIRQGPFSQKAR